MGIGGFLGHDANAALIVRGELAAASQEERFTRKKHDARFPVNAIRDCLEIGGVTAADVTDCIFAEKPFQSAFFDRTGQPGGGLVRWLGRILPERAAGFYTHPARALLPNAKFHFAWHHISHVAGAFHTSPFERAAFLCVDGKGEDYCATAGVVDGAEIKLLWEQPYENGLGLFYALITKYLGFHSFGSEYKVMGLAPYGEGNSTRKLEALFKTDARGGFRLRRPVRFNEESMNDGVAWIARVLGMPARRKEEVLTDTHIDIATSLQRIFETEIFKMSRYLQDKTGEENLIFCGGCAQNCVAAGKLRAQGGFRQVFNSPVGGDMGSGLGAALLLERNHSGGSFKAAAKGFYLGSDPGQIPDAALPWRVPVTGDLHSFVARELADGKVVGWVRGAMELGARALGGRSILADPRRPDMQSLLNLKVKFRESFRPFAPAVLADRVGDWFDSVEESDYMNYTANLRTELRVAPPHGLKGVKERLDFARCKIPSVVHVDYSARLQTVRQKTHPDFYRLIKAFADQTGVPILINTSFNVSGQPIVRTAVEAWECFLNTDIDLLVLNDYVFRNPFVKSREEKLAWLDQFEKSA